MTLQSAVEAAQHAGDSEGGGLAALTIIEELGTQLSADELGDIYQCAAELLAASRNIGTHARLSACASRVLFLVDALRTPPTWKNFSLKEALRRYEGRIIERALRDSGGMVTRAAQRLGFKHHYSLIAILNSRQRELLSARKPIMPRRRSIMFVNDSNRERRKLTILSVEDDGLAGTAVKDMLKREGWTVETFGKGYLGLTALSGEGHYDVLIFDRETPGLSGVELIRETRRIPHRQRTPIIMLSASDVEKEARQAGANAFLRKPEQITALAETIARLLAGKSKQTAKGKNGEKSSR
jgi:DNA-binding NtrC family response regulator